MTWPDVHRSGATTKATSTRWTQSSHRGHRVDGMGSPAWWTLERVKRRMARRSFAATIQHQAPWFVCHFAFFSVTGWFNRFTFALGSVLVLRWQNMCTGNVTGYLLNARTTCRSIMTTVGYDPRASIHIEEPKTIIPPRRANSYQFNE